MRDIPDECTVVAWCDVCQWYQEYTVMREDWADFMMIAEKAVKDHTKASQDCKIDPEMIRLKALDPSVAN